MSNKLPRGIFNNNPGNLIISRIPWKNKIPISLNTDKKFEQFKTMEYGIRAMMMDLKHDIKNGLNTICKLITSYAPECENDTKRYIEVICKSLGMEQFELLKPDHDTIILLSKAISFHENGGHYITNDQLENAWLLI
jgi:hypothetical protein